MHWFASWAYLPHPFAPTLKCGAMQGVVVVVVVAVVQELGRRDDLWSMLFVITDMAVRGVPWREHRQSREECGAMKKVRDCDRLARSVCGPPFVCVFVFAEWCCLPCKCFQTATFLCVWLALGSRLQSCITPISRPPLPRPEEKLLALEASIESPALSVSLCL